MLNSRLIVNLAWFISSKIIFFPVDYHPTNTQLSTNLTNNTVAINKGIKLTCSAQAKPPAEYRFFDSLLNNTVAGSSAAYATSIISTKENEVIYSCTPFNYYDNGPTKTVTVTVLRKYITTRSGVLRCTSGGKCV